MRGPILIKLEPISSEVALQHLDPTHTPMTHHYNIANVAFSTHHLFLNWRIQKLQQRHRCTTMRISAMMAVCSAASGATAAATKVRLSSTSFTAKKKKPNLSLLPLLILNVGQQSESPVYRSRWSRCAIRSLAGSTTERVGTQIAHPPPGTLVGTFLCMASSD